MKRNNLAGAWEAVGRKVVEVVAADVKQLRLGGEASRDFGVTPSLTCGMLGFNLGRVKTKRNIINYNEKLLKSNYNCQITHAANVECGLVLSRQNILCQKGNIVSVSSSVSTENTHITVTVNWTLDFLLGSGCGWGAFCAFCALVILLKLVLQRLPPTAAAQIQRSHGLQRLI